MNKVFKVVFNQSLGIFLAVSELAKGKVKSQSNSASQVSSNLNKANKGAIFTLSTLAMAITASFTPFAEAELSENTTTYLGMENNIQHYTKNTTYFDYATNTYLGHSSLVIDTVFDGNIIKFGKPEKTSNQFFFSMHKYNTGKIKDNTREQFAETISAMNKYREKYGSWTAPDYSSNVMDTLRFFTGSPVEGYVFQETLELGVNVDEPNPKIPNIQPTYPIIKSNKPTFIEPKTPIEPHFTLNTPTPPEKVIVQNNFHRNSLEIKVAPVSSVEDILINESHPVSVPKITMKIETPEVHVNFVPKELVEVKVPNPQIEEKIINPVEPNANPFTSFGNSNGWRRDQVVSQALLQSGADWSKVPYYGSFINNKNLTGGVIWNGVEEPLFNDAGEMVDKDGNPMDPADLKSFAPKTEVASDAPVKPAGIKDLNNTSSYDRGYLKRAAGTIGGINNWLIHDWTTINNWGARNPKPIKIDNIKLFIAGVADKDFDDLWTTKDHDIPEAKKVYGTTGISGTNYEIKGSEFYLYDRSAMGKFEMRGGMKIDFLGKNKLHIYGEDTTTFLLTGTRPNTAGNPMNDMLKQTGRQTLIFNGNLDLDMNTQRNILYSVKDYAAGLKIEEKGKVNFNGASNTGVVFTTFAANKYNYIDPLMTYYGTSIPTSEGVKKEDFIPSVEMTGSLNLYGDENIGILFDKQKESQKYMTIDRMPFNVGVHQGYFNLNFNIGTALNSDTNKFGENQLGAGNIKSYEDTKIDGNIGVYVRSGQREGIPSVMNDPKYYYTRYMSKDVIDIINHDKIHNLYLDKFNIHFGKYSKDGYMFLAKNGSVVEILPQNPVRKDLADFTPQTSFSDGINGKDTKEEDASTSTIIAYAEGKWDKDANFLLDNTTDSLQGKPTEIIVGQNLDMVSKEGSAFFGNKGGKITFNGNGANSYAEGLGYKSIMAYAKDGGTVVANGNLIAKDGNVTNEENKYLNIGALAEQGTSNEETKVTVNGNLDIHGIGAYAKGQNTVIELKGTDNKIDAKKEAALVALDGGSISVKQATIDFKGESIPFYADKNAASKITFQGDTVINMHSGAIFSGEKEDYSANTAQSGETGKYTGMKNVTINLKSNNVNLGYFDAANLKLDANGNSFLDSLRDDYIKVAAINAEGHWYKSSLLGGKLEVDKNVNLDNVSNGDTVGDTYNDIRMEKSVVTFNAGNVVSSATGKGLSMASNKTATSNTQSGFLNKGNISITGGQKGDSVAVYVGYGNIQNQGEISIDHGIGALGVNGSLVANDGELKIQDGIGILGMTHREDKGTVVTDNYGTDAKIANNNLGTDMVIDIQNNKNIAVTEAGGIGIYGKNNDENVALGNTSILNASNATINVGNSSDTETAIGIYGDKVQVRNEGKITVGDSAVAIYGEHGTSVNLTNSKDITLGNHSIEVMLDGASTVDGKLKPIGKADSKRQIALYLNGNEGTNPKVIANNIDTTEITAGIGLYANKAKTEYSGTMHLDQGDVGIYLEGDATNPNLTAENKGTINLGKAGIAMYSKNGKLINSQAILATGNDSVAFFLDGEDASFENTGNITLSGDGASAIALAHGAKLDIDANTLTNVTITGNKTKNFFANKSTINVKGDITFKTPNEKGNIFIYGQDGSDIHIDAGKTLTVDGTTNTTSNNKTVGVYLDNSKKGNFFEGKLNIIGNALGVYSSRGNTLAIDGTTVTDSIGAYLDGTSTVSGNITINKGIGIYGKGEEAKVAGTPTLTLTKEDSIGIYLTNEASLIGKVKINNTWQDSRNVGVYYGIDKGKTVDNKGSIALIGKNSLGIYVGKGGSLSNENTITSVATGEDNIGVYVSESSDYLAKEAATIAMDGKDSIGIFTDDGNTINKGTIDVSQSTGQKSVGMVVKATTSKIARMENQGSITAGENLGMYVAGSGVNEASNTGSISSSNAGVYVEGATSSFDGRRGTISSEGGVGIALKDTVQNKIQLGTMDITSTAAKTGVVVSADNAKVDFNVTASGDNILGIYAKNKSEIVGNTIEVMGKGSRGIFLDDDSVKVSNVNISTGKKDETDPNNVHSSVGIIVKNQGDYSIENTNINAQNGVGLLVDNGTTVTFSGAITTRTGNGAFVGENATLSMNAGSLHIRDGGTGVYVKDGVLNIGQTEDFTMDFKTPGAIGIFSDNGEVHIGKHITEKGKGRLLLTTNSTVTSKGDIQVEHAHGLLGIYTNKLSANRVIINGSKIEAKDSATGIIAVKGDANLNSVYKILAINGINSEISVADKSIGMYSDVATIYNLGEISVGKDSVGISGDNTGKILANNLITINGENALGIYNFGELQNFSSKTIVGDGKAGKGIMLSESNLAELFLGDVNLSGEKSVGTLIKGSTVAQKIYGNLTVASKGSALILEDSGANVITLDKDTTLSAGDSSVGIYAKNTKFHVENIEKVSVGDKGTFIAGDAASISFNKTMNVKDSKIGILAKGGKIEKPVNVSVNGKGTGVIIYETDLADSNNLAITLGEGNSNAEYAIGAYYQNVNGITVNPSVQQQGKNSVGFILENSSSAPTHSFGNIALTKENQIGIKAENASFKVDSIHQSGNKENYGIFAENNSSVEVSGDILVEETSEKPKIAAVLNNSDFKGNNVTVRDANVGIFAKDMDAIKEIVLTGKLNVEAGENVGVFATGSGTIKAKDMAVKEGSLGILANGMNVDVQGTMDIHTNSAIGILSTGEGNITFEGDVNLAAKDEAASIGIYKKDAVGNSTIDIGPGAWNISDFSYGVYLKKSAVDENAQISVTSSGGITLGKGAVAFVSNGDNSIISQGKITLGESTKENSSVGMYLRGGSYGENQGSMEVNYEKSVGAYVEGTASKFVNSGLMKVDNGGVGILVKRGGTGINNGKIEVRGKNSIGMAGYLEGTKLVNNGEIEVFDGRGIFKGNKVFLENKGKIKVHGGVGISGIDADHPAAENVTLEAGSTGVATKPSSMPPAIDLGHVSISGVDDGGKGSFEITLGNTYITEVGATFETAGNMILDGAYVDIAQHHKVTPESLPVFTANEISGKINILPNFISEGNGMTYEVKNFIKSLEDKKLEKITPVVSPMFIAKMTEDGDLLLVKRPYVDTAIGTQFEEMDKGMDNIYLGKSEDKHILQEMNRHLGEIFQAENTDAPENMNYTKNYQETFAKYRTEIRGDIYANIEDRIESIEKAFETSFDELESSYNTTRNVNKYSVIYSDGDYKNDTLGIVNYDYAARGLLYMRELESDDLTKKYGFTLGFANTKFDFDGTNSKEKVFSLRAGIHRKQLLTEDKSISLLTRGSIGFNRHHTERSINLYQHFENKAKFNSYGFLLEADLKKAIAKTRKFDMDIYSELKFEHQRFENFKESGNLKLEIAGNHYNSVQGKVGVRGERRFYIDSDFVVKAGFDLNYAREFGNYYNGNKARLVDGDAGYYHLIEPEKRKGILAGKLSVGLEKENHYGVNISAETVRNSNSRQNDNNFSLRFHYKW